MPLILNRRNLLAATAAAAALPALPVGAAARIDPVATGLLHGLFEQRWQAQMKAYPEWASYLGDHRYGDRLTDASPAAQAARYALARAHLAQARALQRAALSAPDRVSLDIFVHELLDFLRFAPFVGYRSLSLGAQGGFHTEFGSLLRACPADRSTEAEQILARMAAYPRRVEQEVANLRAGMALGWVPPRHVLERVPPQIDGQIEPALEAGPFFEPFTRLGTEIRAADQERLRARARRAIGEQVLPALRTLRRFVVDEYLSVAATDGAFNRYPDGERVYAAKVQSETTTDLSVAQIHALGLREVVRLRGEIEAVMGEMGFAGDFKGFIRHLTTDPKYFVAGPDALLAAYRDIAKRIDAELPRLFAELPRAPYGVRAMPEHSAIDASEYYDGPALDGSRPGWFNANTKAWRTRPVWGMETLVAHEAVPGHHLQSARAVELANLPAFRRAGGYTAYGEGWAVYAETLGFELGLYKDPASRFGHLQWQAFRAARLVVDTGLHAFGWTRQQAIDYLVDHTGEDRELIAAEVDRYYSDPAQALAYTIGALKIIELRDRARQRLGERFELRRFHSAILDQGSVPLPVLERAVQAWMRAEQARAGPRSETAGRR